MIVTLGTDENDLETTFKWPFTVNFIVEDEK